MTIKYYLRGKGSTVPVYIRVSISREKLFRKKTRFIANSENWNKDKSLQLKLRKLQNEIEQSYNDVLIHNEKWIDTIIYSEFKEETVQTQVDKIINTASSRKNHKQGVGLSEGRIKILKTFNRLLDRYHPKLPLIACDSQLVGEFQNWLFDQGYSVNYVGKNIELLKTACRDAEKEGKRIILLLNQSKR